MQKRLSERGQNIEQKHQDQKRFDLAARAAWLAYALGRTQDEIAAELNVSRQNAQRLIALASAAGLVKFRLDHPLADCIAKAQKLRDKFSLKHVEVVPSAQSDEDNRLSVGIAVASYIETLLSQTEPQILCLGTGRTLRSAVHQMPLMEKPKHKIVSLIGTVGPDGRASPYDVVMRLADRVGAQCYPLPMPVLADGPEERRMLQSQKGLRALHDLAEEARTWIVGVGDLGSQASLHVDGFITDEELAELQAKGAVGEILGWAFDGQGGPVKTSIHDRLIAVGLATPIASHRTIIAASVGAHKIAPLLGALRGGLVNGVLTDERTAQTLIEAP
ncbi:sugar-binding transcriptional regulator [Beijerinckia indica]|uniref:Transcriptional regulator, DeoR family n=1 Tax=Beijerinckia indica subsp. indica (strain ATCC 9039 / DSM 1715 / NCIMB 8712) TaxID=395963 RepID=B2ICS6_BEII9|nr:sugar-binding transcriptional regulator [Beijerinckia indica]ACB95350.1 transcriptional regulator, DeoR family [Beijerinckia indica subsp. indica ATCC 9039]